MKTYFIEKDDLWAIGFLGLGLFGYLLRAINYFLDIPGDLGDARFNSVILEHIFNWLVGYDTSLWSPRFFYPFENVLAFSDNHFGSSIFYILFRLAGFSREIAFDGWFLIGGFLSFLASFYSLRWLGFCKFSCAVGAFVFAFGLPVLAKENNAQLIYRFAIPLAFSSFAKFIENSDLKFLSEAIFWVSVQFYCSIYLGMFLFYLVVSMLISDFILSQSLSFNKVLAALGDTKKSSLVVLSFIAFFCISSVIWLLYQYYIVSTDYGFKKPLAEMAAMLPRLSSYLISDRVSVSSWIGQWVGEVPIRQEHQLFFGFGVWVLVIYGLIAIWRGCNKENLGKISLLAFGILFVVTLNVNEYSFYFLLAKLPGIGAIRAVSRISLVMLMPISVLVAVGAEYIFNLANKKSELHMSTALFMVTLFVSIEVFAYQPYRTPMSFWASRQNSLKPMLPLPLNKEAIIFVTTKGAEPYLFAELDGMVLAQDLGVPTLNGYSGNAPPGYLEPLPCYSYQNRFITYAHHRRLKVHEIQKEGTQLVLISPSPCEYEPIIAFQGPITADQAEGLALKINDVKIFGKKIEIKILAHNTALMNFNTVSIAGQPVRMSWRFVPLSPTGDRMSEPAWDARKDLLWTITPGNSKEVTVITDLPEGSGKYLLEVSLVQEHVAWFQQLGMAVPSYPITVDGI